MARIGLDGFSSKKKPKRIEKQVPKEDYVMKAYINSKHHIAYNMRNYVFGSKDEKLFMCEYEERLMTFKCWLPRRKAEAIRISYNILIREDIGKELIAKRYRGKPFSDGSLINLGSVCVKVIKSIVQDNGTFYELFYNKKSTRVKSHEDILEITENQNPRNGYLKVEVKGLSNTEVFVRDESVQSFNDGIGLRGKYSHPEEEEYYEEDIDIEIDEQEFF